MPLVLVCFAHSTQIKNVVMNRLTATDNVGMALFAGNIAYCAAALLSGWLTDTTRRPVIIAFAGLCFVACGTYMFGPVGWPFPVQLDVLFVGVAIAVWGAGIVDMPVFPYAVHCAGAKNIEVVSALVCACDQLGAIVGCIACTQVSHAYSVRVAMISWTGVAVLLVLWAAILSITTGTKSRIVLKTTPHSE